MRIVSTTTLKRAAVPSLAAGLLLAAFAAPAAAQAPADSTATRVDNTVTVTTRLATTPNPVRMRVNSGGSLIIEDSSGITPGPGCTRFGTGNTAVDCGPASTVTRLSVSLRDKA
ncbi:hypothetical protein ABT063_00865 [Streptomyces sp. NPDC002838]|uniref:hypothetical protein n=1 Tax=Streptomyces sp. NPDC002838 TaxID=3154436 RepID=UPI0033188237